METTYKKKTVFIAACAGMLLFGITLITLGSVTVDLTARFSLDAKNSGTIFSILPIGILIGSFLFGPICDKYGYKPILSFAALCMFQGFQGIAFTQNLAVLYIAVFLFGFGGGIINTGTNALVSDISENNKGANLSILGVFFGLGAIGMPLLIGLFKPIASSFSIVSGVGVITLLVYIFYLSIAFPKEKVNTTEVPQSDWKRLLSPLLLLISMVLFFQSSLEAIINNWTTTFLIEEHGMQASDALYALSLHMAGMIVMRVLLGSVMRSWKLNSIMWLSLGLIFMGILTMQVLTTTWGLFGSLIISGAGLAAGFPAMLGLVGEKYSAISGKAFSLAFGIALIGNILINYLMGYIIQNYGILSLLTVCYIETALMALFFTLTMKQKNK
ncbi:MAG: MFS transporter [Pedobacter sp.]|nr:MAG: MFS transporter [Pedobacter sp.]